MFVCKRKNPTKRKGWAAVTGASSGIGMEFARELAAAGFDVMLVARRRNVLEELSAELSGRYGTKCRVIAADLCEEKECRRVLEELEGEQLTIFINNAGFGDCGYFPETNLDKSLAMIDLNVRALHLLTSLVLQKMQSQGGGYLLNVASSAGLFPAGPFMATYYATKAYVVSLTRGIAEELRQKGSPVYVGVLCPGPVQTDFDRVAEVEFSLDGISPRRCVRCALRGLRRRRIVIVPTLWMKLAVLIGRITPQQLAIRTVSGQQRKKLPEE